MERRLWTWHSPSLHREMTVACWGHYGKPVLLFATAASDCLDYERFHLVTKLAPLIEAGRIKLYSAGSVAGDGWLSKTASNRHKTWLQARFDDYLTQELLPHIERDCDGHRGYGCAGSSIGAYNAVTATCKHPEWFDLAVAMSGTYDFDRWVGDYRDQDYYFNQPMYFVPNLPEGPQLDRLRQARIVIASGTGRYEAPDESRRMAEVLQAKGVPAQLELWGTDAHHDWPTWRTMLPMFLDRLVP